MTIQRPFPLTMRWWHAKWYALRRLAVMVRFLRNWREVWTAYRTARPIPTLRLRAGYEVEHGAGDEPVLLLQEVCAMRVYARAEPPEVAVIIDGGANIGMATLDWLRRFPKARVHAYEPGLEAFRRLTANVRRSGHGDRATLFQEALSGLSGTVVFNVSESSVRSSLFPLPRDVPAAATERVPAVSLKDAIQRAGGAITLLKLDVEGAEADILERSERATLQAIERVVVEYHDDLVPDAAARSRAALEGAGFTCTVRRESADQGLLYAVRGPNR